MLPERQRTLRGAITWSHACSPSPSAACSAHSACLPAAGRSRPCRPSPTPKVTATSTCSTASSPSRQEPRSAWRQPRRAGPTTRCDSISILSFANTPTSDSMSRPAGGDERPASPSLERVAHEPGRADPRPGRPGHAPPVDHEQHNLRAALAWSMDWGRHRHGLRIMRRIWRWFQQRAHLREGRALAHDLLAAPSAVAAPTCS